MSGASAGQVHLEAGVAKGADDLEAVLGVAGLEREEHLDLVHPDGRALAVVLHRQHVEALRRPRPG